jgi:hypothetical protein
MISEIRPWRTWKIPKLRTILNKYKTMASNIRQNSTLLFYVEHFSFLWTFGLHSRLYFVQVCILHSYVFILFDCSHFTFKFAFRSPNFLHSTFKFVFYIHKFSFYSTVRILHSSLHFIQVFQLCIQPQSTRHEWSWAQTMVRATE